MALGELYIEDAGVDGRDETGVGFIDREVVCFRPDSQKGKRFRFWIPKWNGYLDGVFGRSGHELPQNEREARQYAKVIADFLEERGQMYRRYTSDDLRNIVEIFKAL